jgi:hypothetical protein
VAEFEKAKEEPVIAAVPPEEKPATPAKSKKMKEEPAIAPAPTDAKPATPEKLEIFRSRWKDVVSATKGMGSQGNLDALLRSACEPVAVDGDTLVLGFYYEFHKEKIEDPKYRHMVEAKVSEVFGAPYKIRCVLTERKKRGGLVEAALQMGAKIVDTEEE